MYSMGGDTPGGSYNSKQIVVIVEALSSDIGPSSDPHPSILGEGTPKVSRNLYAGEQNRSTHYS